MISRLLALLCFALVMVTSVAARADRCGPDATAWVNRCAIASGLKLRLDSCPSAVAVVGVETPALRVEISTSPTAFRRVGSHGLAPIGDFPDWKTQPAPVQAAFEALARCVELEPPEPLLSPAAPPPVVSESTRRHPLPFLFLGAVLATAVSALLSRVTVRRLAIAIGALAAIVLVRRLLQPAMFFHQNGLGPEWVRFALQADAGSYGPGYPELLGWIASRARRPDWALFVANELLAATVPISAYAIARAVGARRLLSLALAAALAVDPVLTRLGRSESYYAAIIAFVFAATAVVVVNDRHRIPARCVGLLAAGLFLGQAARIHPVAWIACAVVPLAVICRPGRFLRRVVRAAIATLAVGTVALGLALPAMRAVLRGTLASVAHHEHERALTLAPVAIGLMLLCAGAIAVRRVRPTASRAAVLVLVVFAAIGSNVLETNIAVVSAAYLHTFFPVALAAVASLLALIKLRRWMVPAAVVLAALVHTAREHPLVAPTTDNHELSWCLEWRETLPARARVASVSRADRRVLILPLFGTDLPYAVTADAIGPNYYYRSSLCSTPEGRPFCESFESQHRLRPLATRRLPSRESASWLPLPPGEIEVALFAVEPGPP